MDIEKFKTILIAIFLAIFVFAVLIFAGVIKVENKSSKSNKLKGEVIIWGVFKSRGISNVFSNITEANEGLKIKYVEKSESTYQQDLIKAYANGVGPDSFFITPDMIIGYSRFIHKIPYESYPEKIFRDLYIDGAEIYLDEEGIIGFPVVVDPLVMYYNKDIFSNQAIASIPKYWEELFNLSSSLTRKENNGIIHQSMIALGQYDNINNSKDILATLFIQNGNSMVNRMNKGYTTILNNVKIPLTFFMQFTNPSNSAYSWNRSLPNSFDMFIGSKLALYLGFGSELFKIQSANPNLSFDVTQIPQTKGDNPNRTFGKIYALAISKKSKNISTALGLASILMANDNSKNLATVLSLPPVSRVLLSERPKDPYLFTFFNSAIISRSWLDPNDISSEIVFSELIENILSNKLDITNAISRAQDQLNIIINQNLQ